MHSAAPFYFPTRSSAASPTGTASHVIGISRAIEEFSLIDAVSSLSLSVESLLTAMLFPFVRALLL
ncbi:MAG: LrgB family protein [Oscillospiraceae bacterium]|nr:LrgB family protein [Oscillospiraceae bacterium]